MTSLFGQKSVYKPILDLIPLGTALVSRRCIILAWNTQAGTLFGIPEAKAIGTDFSTFFFQQKKDVQAYIDEGFYKDRREPKIVEVIIKGEKKYLEIRSTRLSKITSEEGLLLTFVDVSKRMRAIAHQQKAEEELERSKEELEVIFQNVADGITVQDPSGKLLFANLAAAKTAGFNSVKEFLTSPLKDLPKKFELINEEGERISFEDLPGRKALMGEKNPQLTIGYKYIKNDEIHWSQIKARPVFDKDKNLLYAINIFHDITHMKKAEEHAELREKQQEALAKLGQFALEAETPKQVFDYAVKVVAETLQVEYCQVFKLQSNQKQLVLVSGVGWRKKIIGKAIVGTDKNSHAGFTMLSRKPIIVTDLRAEKRFRASKLLIDHKVISGLSTVIAGKKESFGVIGAHTTHKREFTVDDSQFLVSVANILASKIENYEIERALKKSEERYRMLIELAPDVIYSLSPEGKFVELNSAFELVTGWTKEDWIGKFYKKLVHPDDLQLAIQKFKEGVHGKASSPYELRIPTKSGDYIYAEFRSKPLDVKDKIVGKMGIFRDITERKHEERQRDYMLGIASHELKTPIATIKAFAQILQRNAIKERNEKYVDYLTKIDYQINKLTKLIGDLLDITRIRAGKLEMRESVFYFDDLVNEVIEDIQPMTQTHTIIKKGHADTYIVADKDRIGRVLLNLLTNAIKYSPDSDKVIVTLKSDKNMVMASIKDFGIGIKKGDTERIFEPFTYIANHGSSKVPSIGLGLYISSQLVRAHGGKIWVKSKENVGSTFFISLPTRIEEDKNHGT